jgi:hypothetical protein
MRSRKICHIDGQAVLNKRMNSNDLQTGRADESNLMSSEAMSESNLMQCAIVKNNGIILMK